MFKGGRCFLSLLLLSHNVVVAFLVAMTKNKNKNNKQQTNKTPEKWACDIPIQYTRNPRRRRKIPCPSRIPGKVTEPALKFKLSNQCCHISGTAWVLLVSIGLYVDTKHLHFTVYIVSPSWNMKMAVQMSLYPPSKMLNKLAVLMPFSEEKERRIDGGGGEAGRRGGRKNQLECMNEWMNQNEWMNKRTNKRTNEKVAGTIVSKRQKQTADVYVETSLCKRI